MATQTRSISLSELSSMSDRERTRRVDELFQAALTPNKEQLKEQVDALNSRIEEFESQHNLPSSQMLKLVESGQLPETMDVCSWLMLLKKRGRFEKRQQTSAYQF